MTFAPDDVLAGIVASDTPLFGGFDALTVHDAGRRGGAATRVQSRPSPQIVPQTVPQPTAGPMPKVPVHRSPRRGSRIFGRLARRFAVGLKPQRVTGWRRWNFLRPREGKVISKSHLSRPCAMQFAKSGFSLMAFPSMSAPRDSATLVRPKLNQSWKMRASAVMTG